MVNLRGRLYNCNIIVQNLMELPQQLICKLPLYGCLKNMTSCLLILTYQFLQHFGIRPQRSDAVIELINVRSPIWTYQFLQYFNVRSAL